MANVILTIQNLLNILPVNIIKSYFLI
ncbi:MAG: hypothetical protein RIR11_2892, partial [Bacteroidota bacterium]